MTNDNTRRAALLLHGAGAADRDWLLQQLDTKSRALLREMLAELMELGIPRERSVLHDALAATRPATPESTSTVEESIRKLCALPAAAVLHAIQHEPSALIAVLIRCAEWPWTSQVMEGLGPIQRRRVEEYMECGDEPPCKLRTTVITAVLSAATQASAMAAPVPVRRESRLAVLLRSAVRGTTGSITTRG